MIQLAPTEPTWLLEQLRRALPDEKVRTSSRPESRGADVLFRGLDGWVAIQRKTYPDDLLASVADGRLQREVALLSQEKVAVLIVEGHLDYMADGTLIDFSQWTLGAVRNLLRSVLRAGIYVERTEGPDDTVAAVVEMVSYYRKTEHLSLSTRPKAVGSDHWGRTTPHHEMLFFLQGLPLVGPKLAEAILQHFSGLPLGWTCTPGDLRAVPGIGPNRVKRIWEFFNGKPIT